MTTKHEYELLKVREFALGDFNRNLEISNKIWEGVLKLIITLSSTFILVSVALVEKVFPSSDNTFSELPLILVSSWLSLISAIVFGIIQQLVESIFHGNQANNAKKLVNETNKKIAKGLTTDHLKNDIDKVEIIYNDVVWGAISIDSFILALALMSMFLLQRCLPVWLCWLIFVLFVLFIGRMNYYLLKKRKGN